MRYLFGAVFAIAVLSMLVLSTGEATAEEKAKEERPDWGPWNTWFTAKKGEWAEYSVGYGIKTRYEVNSFEGGIVNYQHATYNAAGEETGSKEKKLPPARCAMPRLSFTDAVRWSTGTATVGEVTLQCDVATWMSGKKQQEVWFSKDVPCGGLVRSAIDGKASVWLIGFHNESAEAKASDPEDPNALVKEAATGSADLPPFYRQAGNSMLLRLRVTGQEDRWQMRRVVEVSADSASLTYQLCKPDGSALPDAPVTQIEQNSEAWNKQYAKPAKTGQKMKVEAGEFVCDYFERKVRESDVQEWIAASGVVVKTVVKAGESETVMELVKLEMKDQPTEDSKAEPEDE